MGTRKKRAFIGQTTPIAYDYRTEIRDVRNPEPILESINGLLICYDEIWFPSRVFCPFDMQDLDYVKFLEDDPILLQQAREAKEQFTPDWEDSEFQELERSGEGYNHYEVVDMLRDRFPFLQPDSHGRTWNGFDTSNNSMRQFIQDVGIASSIGDDIELITNSKTAYATRQAAWRGRKGALDHYGHSAAEEIALVRTADFRGPNGCYHPSIEELRGDRNVREFRQLLAETSPSSTEVVQLVNHVNKLTNAYAAKASEKYQKGNGRLETVGNAMGSLLLGLLFPGYGALYGGGMSGARYLSDRVEQKRTAGTAFVITARTKADGRSTYHSCSHATGMRGALT